MKLFATGVGGQLGHDVVNELISCVCEAVRTDIAKEYAGVADESHVTTVPYVQRDITNRNVVKDIIEPSSMTIEYASAKNTINLTKHGISFATVSLAFNDPNVLISYDEQHSTHEDCYTLLGTIGSQPLHYVHDEGRSDKID